MFGFFKKKPKMPQTSDKIWMSEESKWNGFLSEVKLISAREGYNSNLDNSHSDILDSNWDKISGAQKKICVLYFFEETKKNAIKLLEKNDFSTIELEKASMIKKTGELLIFTASAFDLERSIRLQNTLKEYIELGDCEIIFVEHYPLYSKQKAVLEKIALLTNDTIKACFYISMKAPLMEVFGTERIVELMSRMGTKDEDMLEHPMMSSAINKAQQKLDKEVKIERKANSQAQWFKINYKVEG
jgi:hypothetical protein